MASTLTNFIYHFVFSTKQRQLLISNELTEELYSYIGGIVREQKGRLLEIGGTEDHLHLLMLCHPAVSIADMMRHVKGSSSKWINAKSPHAPISVGSVDMEASL